MTKQRKIFFDLDGTLLYTNEENVRCEVIDAINKLKDRGDHIYVATGRSIGQAKHILKQIGIEDGIFANGQMIINDGKIVYEHYIPEDISAKVLNLARENKLYPATISPKGMKLKCDFINLILLYKLRKYSFGGIGHGRLKNQSNQGFWYFGKPEHVEKIVDKIDTKYFNVYPYGGNTLEIMPKNFNKADGIKKLIANEPDCYTVAFGDGRNDIEMINTVDFAIAMGNANDKLKAAADYVTATNDDHGIIKGIDYLLNIQD